ncbi:peptidase S41 [Leptolyngbya sp. 'hensonii']|uniref:carboxyl-terminal processing protease CtpB n=1 Tax=Leptolyngbya sp. 'hensonii' TaxID=1922337 RepID=UPI00094F8D2C|nr:carboxyl-terminal processing protease CtpB [Leptolyngbya sp. 'hensonii']OLP16105.1 peptidase S41 [Leptolyngbya sp. 'hensonii']
MKFFSRRPNFFQTALLTGAVVTATALHLPGTKAQATFQDSPKVVVDEAWQIVNRDYVDGSFNKVDWLMVRQRLLSVNYNSREEAYSAIREALEKLGDPYTRFMDPKQYQSLTNQTRGELSGIGIRLELNEQTRMLTVVEPIDNSPASKAGIRTGDRILMIENRPTQGMTVEEASSLIRGEVGTKLNLRLLREGAGEINLTLTRAQIELPTVSFSIRQEGQEKIGYIRLSEFSSHAADQMRRAINELQNQKVDAFVLDLRGNPGGLLQASIEISRMWVDTGSIVRTVDRRGRNEEMKANRTALTNLPLVVLVDGNSASSSEILTGALKDNGRAMVVGSQTFGKALVQSVHPLSDGSGLAVTIAHYYTPKGTDISKKGITPDVTIDLTDAQRQVLVTNPKLIGTREDPQYARAVTVLQTTALTRPNFNQSARQSNTN